MKLKNEALQKLYDDLMSSDIVWLSPCAEAPADKMFRECDERLSGSATFAYIKELQKRTDIFKKDLDEAKSSLEYFKTSRNDWRSRAKHEEEEKVEQVKRADNLKTQIDKILGENVQLKQDHESDVRVIGKLHSQMVDLEEEKIEQVKRADILKSQRDMLKKELDELKPHTEKVIDAKLQLQREVEQLKKDLDALLSRVHCAEDEAEQLKKDKEQLEHSRIEWFKKATERGRELHDAEEKIRELKKDRDIWVRNQELKKRINSLYGVDSDGYIQRLLDNIRKNCYDQGQTDLWDMLQNVNDTQPNEFDVECEGMEDVISMDLEDFLDAYKKWQEQKETDRMRDYLERFCIGKVCTGCPLHTPDFKCGRGSWFCDMSAEDIKRHYEKAVGHGRYTLKDSKIFDTTTMEGVNKAITEACENFCKAVRDADIKIKENVPRNSWECTLEAMVEVNKDLFEKLCGMKSEEKKSKPGELVITTSGVTTANYSEATMSAIKEAVRKFEKSLPALDSWESTITGSIKVDDIAGKTASTKHGFEYGDAVRLPWRDYDYMYIGPYEESKTLVRMFDPKNHAMVTSHVGNVIYNGGKIVICDEDDLRKIWKDKK